MNRTKLAAGLALAMTLVCAVFAIDAPPLPEDEAPAANRYNIHIKMVRTNNDGSKTILAAPTVAVAPGIEAYFFAGGETVVAERKVPFGELAKVIATPADAGKVSLAGVIEHSAIVDRGNGVTSRHSDEAYFKRTVELGKMTRLPLSSGLESSQWIELTVEKSDE